jgi:hypothetical protein
VKKHVGLKIAIAGSLVAGTAAAIIALVPAPEDRFQDASRIIESLSRPQQETDNPPPSALATIGKVPNVDPSQIRLLGHSATLTYYGVPADDKICMIPVNNKGEGSLVGCTLLKSFESYGLKMDNEDRTESGWLVVPAAAKNALESVKDEPGWSQQAPNFLIREN